MEPQHRPDGALGHVRTDPTCPARSMCVPRVSVSPSLRPIAPDAPAHNPHIVYRAPRAAPMAPMPLDRGVSADHVLFPKPKDGYVELGELARCFPKADGPAPLPPT